MIYYLHRARRVLVLSPFRLANTMQHRCYNLQCFTGLKVSFNYLCKDDEVSQSKELPIVGKMFFLLTNSLFVQLLTLFFIMVVAFLFFHFRANRLYNEKLNEILSKEKDVVDVDNCQKTSVKKTNNKKDTILLRIEDNKFNQFLNQLKTERK